MFFSESNKPIAHAYAEGGFKKSVDIYEDLINSKTGKLETKKTGSDPFYNRMQEQTEGQLLETLIRRYQIDLNTKHITQVKEELVDMTNLPEDLLETYALTHQLELQFNESPAEVKKHFGTFGDYLKSFQDGSLREKLSNLHNELKGKKPQKVELQVENIIQNPQNTQVVNPGMTEQVPVQNQSQIISQGVNYGQ